MLPNSSTRFWRRVYQTSCVGSETAVLALPAASDAGAEGAASAMAKGPVPNENHRQHANRAAKRKKGMLASERMR